MFVKIVPASRLIVAAMPHTTAALSSIQTRPNTLWMVIGFA
jgi:hypothetical protein